MVAIQAFASCCGASIISSFTYPVLEGAVRYDSAKLMYVYDKEWKTEEELEKHLLAKMGPKRHHMFTAILNKNQTKQGDGIWLRVLHKMGFRCVQHSFNDSHRGPGAPNGSEIYLFVLSWDRSNSVVNSEAQDQVPEGWAELSSAPPPAPPKKKAAPKKKAPAAKRKPAPKKGEALARSLVAAARDPFAI